MVLGNPGWKLARDHGGLTFLVAVPRDKRLGADGKRLDCPIEPCPFWVRGRTRQKGHVLAVCLPGTDDITSWLSSPVIKHHS